MQAECRTDHDSCAPRPSGDNGVGKMSVPRRPATRPARPARRRLLTAALGILLASGCGGARSSPATDVEPGWTEEGVASWYGPDFHGKPTASGEIFDMESMTAAHPSLPLGTRIRVTVLSTGRNTVLRVNDRGPFTGGRILDVSRAAARVLGFLGDGTARVEVRVLDAPAGCWEVQVGAYRDDGNARSARMELEDAGVRVRYEEGPGGVRRVVAGPFATRSGADRVRRRHGGFVRSCAS